MKSFQKNKIDLLSNQDKMKTIKFSRTLSSITLGNIARSNTCRFLKTKPLTHFQISENGITYFQTEMTNEQISRFLNFYGIPKSKYKIIDKYLSSLEIFKGEYDYIPLNSGEPDLYSYV